MAGAELVGPLGEAQRDTSNLEPELPKFRNKTKKKEKRKERKRNLLENYFVLEINEFYARRNETNLWPHWQSGLTENLLQV